MPKNAKKCQKMLYMVQTFRFWYSALLCVTLRSSAAMPLPGSQAHLVVHQLLPPTPPRRNTSRTPGAMASGPRCSRQPRRVPPWAPQVSASGSHQPTIWGYNGNITWYNCWAKPMIHIYIYYNIYIYISYSNNHQYLDMCIKTLQTAEVCAQNFCHWNCEK